MLIDELRTILRDLASQLDAVSAEITRVDDNEVSQRGDSRRRLAPLGQHFALVVELARDADGDALAAIERAARAIRAAGRRWDDEPLIPVRSTGEPTTPTDQVVDKMRAFLGAFCGSTGADVAIVVRRGSVVASSGPLDELQESRLSFIVKRADAEAQREQKSSHAVLFGDDFFAATFYYGATLVAFTSAPHAPDFVRHHARRVNRELVHLLELLDDGPPDPAHVNPVCASDGERPRGRPALPQGGADGNHRATYAGRALHTSRR